MSDSTAPASLADLHAAGQSKFGDYKQAYSEDGELYAVLRHPIRLEAETRKKLADTPTRIEEVQADKPETAAARKVLAEAIEQRDKAPEVVAARDALEDATERLDKAADEERTPRVMKTHQARVDEAQAALDAAIAAHQPKVDEAQAALETAIATYEPSEDEQMAAVRAVVHDMIRLAVASPTHAQGLIDALGEDIPMHIALVERYMGKVQMGEASPSAS